MSDELAVTAHLRAYGHAEIDLEARKGSVRSPFIEWGESSFGGEMNSLISLGFAYHEKNGGRR
ncbi:hypothetical protein X735_30515 [Mesorhizobium sp. L2C085B000]|nr:hypothetical protein X735_30515 [Mesorhizobium sp. L2C085B000]